MKSYQVALSFGGEQRPLVSAVAEHLAAALGRDHVFYDKYYEAELARPDLDVYLHKVYHDRSRLVVVFLGADYERKEWCGLEWRAVRDLIKQKSSEQIMLVRVDEGAVSGVLGIDGYLDARGRSPEEIAEIILGRVRQHARSSRRTAQNALPKIAAPVVPVAVPEIARPARRAGIAPRTLALGGSLAVLVLAGLFLWKAGLLSRQPANFSLTVFVHGAAGPQDVVLRRQGSVMLDLGGERRNEPIGDKGQAIFSEVPASFKGKKVNVALDAEGYELAEPESQRKLVGASLYLAVRKKAGRILGLVRDEAGVPRGGATITVAGLTTRSDRAGNFAITIPGDLLKGELSLQVVADGYPPWRETVVPGSNDIVVTLTPRS